MAYGKLKVDQIESTTRVVDVDNLASLAYLSDKADLVDVKLSTAQLPNLAISQFLGESADEAAMLAKSGQIGDWTIRADISSTYILIDEDPSVLENWRAIETLGGVISVNGEVGAVNLTAADVNALEAPTSELVVETYTEKVLSMDVPANDGGQGKALAASGDYVYVGGPWSHLDVAGTTQFYAGIVRILTKDGENPVLAGDPNFAGASETDNYITAATPEGSAEFGQAVAAADGKVVVGEPYGGNGRAYVYDEGTWHGTQSPVVIDPETRPASFLLGGVVAIGEGKVLVASDNQYVYLCNYDGTDGLFLGPYGGPFSGDFGLAIGDGMFVVGRPYEQKIYVYELNGALIREIQNTSFSNGQFGGQVKIKDGVVYAASQNAYPQGKVHAYRVSDGQLIAEYAPPAVDGYTTFNGFGRSFDLDDQYLIAGARSATGGSYGTANYNTGIAFAFPLDGGDPVTLRPTTLVSNGKFGSAVAVGPGGAFLSQPESWPTQYLYIYPRILPVAVNIGPDSQSKLGDLNVAGSLTSGSITAGVLSSDNYQGDGSGLSGLVSTFDSYSANNGTAKNQNHLDIYTNRLKDKQLSNGTTTYTQLRPASFDANYTGWAKFVFGGSGTHLFVAAADGFYTINKDTSATSQLISKPNSADWYYNGQYILHWYRGYSVDGYIEVHDSAGNLLITINNPLAGTTYTSFATAATVYGNYVYATTQKRADDLTFPYTGAIYKFNISTGALEATIVPSASSGPGSVFSDPFSSQGLVVVNDKIYVADRENDCIVQMNLDGSSQQVIMNPDPDGAGEFGKYFDAGLSLRLGGTYGAHPYIAVANPAAKVIYTFDATTRELVSTVKAPTSSVTTGTITFGKGLRIQGGYVSCLLGNNTQFDAVMFNALTGSGFNIVTWSDLGYGQASLAILVDSTWYVGGSLLTYNGKIYAGRLDGYPLVLEGKVLTSSESTQDVKGDLHFAANKGAILRSPDGSSFRLTVDNSGALSTELVT